MSVYPSIVSSGQYQTVSALPTINAKIAMIGTANTSTSQNIAYHKEAIALAVANLAMDLPGAQVSTAMDEEGGFSLRYVEQYQASTDQIVKRLDVLYGFALVRPELACKIYG